MSHVVSLRAPQSDASHFALSLAESRHRKLDDRLKELGRRALLTPTEKQEIAELKKRKLKIKDELAALRRGA